MTDTENNSGFWLLLAIVILVLSVGSFYLLEQTLIIRVILLLVGVGLSVFTFMRSEQGKKVHSFIIETKIELKKVIWPSRIETVKMTITIIIVVIIISIFLWIIDSLLLWSVQQII